MTAVLSFRQDALSCPLGSSTVRRWCVTSLADRRDLRGMSVSERTTPILHRVAAGEPSAVQLALRQFGPLVWSLARKYCPDHADAEDAVQEVFVELWQKAERYDPRLAAESTFVAMIARRRMIDRLRKKRRTQPTMPISEAADPPSDQRPETRLEIADEARIAAAVLAELPEQQAAVIKLSVYDGMPHSAISEQLDVPLGTVKTQIRRGLIKIREKMLEHGAAGAVPGAVPGRAVPGAGEGVAS